MSGYSVHRTSRYRMNAENGWVDLDPAFVYRGLRMRVARAEAVTTADAFRGAPPNEAE